MFYFTLLCRGFVSNNDEGSNNSFLFNGKWYFFISPSDFYKDGHNDLFSIYNDGSIRCLWIDDTEGGVLISRIMLQEKKAEANFLLKMVI